jgi:hypothetical protein
MEQVATLWLLILQQEKCIIRGRVFPVHQGPSSDQALLVTQLEQPEKSTMVYWPKTIMSQFETCKHSGVSVRKIWPEKKTFHLWLFFPNSNQSKPEILLFLQLTNLWVDMALGIMWFKWCQELFIYFLSYERRLGYCYQKKKEWLWVVTK